MGTRCSVYVNCIAMQRSIPAIEMTLEIRQRRAGPKPPCHFYDSHAYLTQQRTPCSNNNRET